MAGTDHLRSLLDGEAFVPGAPGYDDARRPQNPSFSEIRPALIVRCGSERDVVSTIRHARREGLRPVPRGGGHCLAGRSSTEGVVLDLGALNTISVRSDGMALIGAGVRLGDLYRALHVEARSLPAGCGASVGIVGLTLGGGIGLLGRTHGFTCDRLLGARIVLADGAVLDCDDEHEPDLFWALRGSGGGQFGVVTSLCFATVPEPAAVCIRVRWPGVDPVELITAWQQWAPDAPDALTVDLTIERDPDGGPPRLSAIGASTLPPASTRALLDAFPSAAGVRADIRVSDPMPYSLLKETLSDDARSSASGRIRIRSEFFSRTMSEGTVRSLLSLLVAGEGGGRRLTFTAMGGAYNRVGARATAVGHRGERFLLEHVGETADPWVDASWQTAHGEASGRVYPNFPDPLLEDPFRAYHGDNGPRLSAVKHRYDPHQIFHFPQAIPPMEADGPNEHTKEVRA